MCLVGLSVVLMPASFDRFASLVLQFYAVVIIEDCIHISAVHFNKVLLAIA